MRTNLEWLVKQRIGHRATCKWTGYDNWRAPFRVWKVNELDESEQVLAQSSTVFSKDALVPSMCTSVSKIQDHLMERSLTPPKNIGI
jgi:hypothetical protein